MKKVLIIEDDPVLAESIKQCLASQLYQISKECDGSRGNQLAVREEWDLLLLDLNLPQTSGYVIARNIRNNQLDYPIIAITSRKDPSSKITCWQMGIDKILEKPFNLEELKACIKETLDRPPQKKAEGVRHMDIEYDPVLHCLKRDKQILQLRKMEVDIFAYLLKNKGRIISRAKLYEAVYNWDSDTLETTIDVHMSHLRRKLGRERQYFRTIHSRGYIMDDQSGK